MQPVDWGRQTTTRGLGKGCGQLRDGERAGRGVVVGIVPSDGIVPLDGTLLSQLVAAGVLGAAERRGWSEGGWGTAEGTSE